MKKIFYVILLFSTLCVMTSCASSKSTTTVLSGYSLSSYKYIVFGVEQDGDEELSDIIIKIQNELSYKLRVLSSAQAQLKIEQGEKVLSPKINVKSEKWEGGHTYISISFYDYNTNINVAVVKSSGIGLSISHDQELAFSAIRKELNKVFNK